MNGDERSREEQSCVDERSREEQSCVDERSREEQKLVGAPRISRLRAALITVAALTLAGVAVGTLWAWLAPAIHGIVALTKDGDRIRAYLGNEGDHFFTGAFLLLGMTCVVAVVAAVLVWQWRAHRGPVLVSALSIGAAAAAAAAAAVGAVLVRIRYGVIDVATAPISPEHRVHYVVEAPPVFFGHSPLLIAVTVMFPAAIAALVYSLTAVAAPRDDLGAWPPVDEAPVGFAVTADGARPSGP